MHILNNLHYHKLLRLYINSNNNYIKIIKVITKKYNLQCNEIDIIFHISLYSIYPFLKDLWASYESFDKTVQDDEKYNNYKTLCGMFLEPLTDYEMEHNNFCMELVRNLGIYSENIFSLNFIPDRCNNLNYWIYNSIKKHNIQDNLINQCFEDYFQLTKRASNMVECKYHSYDKSYDDPMIAIMINIFNTHVSDVIGALKSSSESTYISGHKFVCDCVKIYKNMKSKYCSNENPNDVKKKICADFKTFEFTYTTYLLDKNGLMNKIPSLNNIENEYSNMCRKYEETTVSANVPTVKVPGTLSSDGDSEGTTHETLTATPVNVETGNNPISSTVSTSLGAVAGASSVLALLYKVNK
ncbi:hypothetical protein PVNG_02181 [Plasmodium vivax North Korean]|uniref:Variable surface protein n=1 Tax=Plasmodium vivax North Korean TaxID=1035514 RepID=A0A0J9WDQ1_PLAVI|nr:hypothetical protein PVNG_02181 [Plasmodium vivax North Korean]